MKEHEFYGIVLFIIAIVFWVICQECENNDFRNRIEKLENNIKSNAEFRIIPEKRSSKGD